LPMARGDAMRRELAQMRETLDRLNAHNLPVFSTMAGRLGEAHAALTRATDFMSEALANATELALAGATPYLRLFAIVRGGTALAETAMAAHSLAGAGDKDRAHSRRIASARFFTDNVATAATGLATSIVEGHEFVTEDWAALAG
jgi:acyl-CoA dehydrogenase